MVGSKGKSQLALWSICWLFLVLGCICFGGMWAAIDRLNMELRERRGLLSIEEQKSLMLTAALIPAPKFLAFAAMVGYRLGGISGAVCSSIFILLPGTVLVVAACMLVIATSHHALDTIQHYVGLAVIGLLIGNALRMFVSDGINFRSAIIGFIISLGIPIYVFVFDGSMIIAACSTLSLGSLLIRGSTIKETSDVE